LTIRHTENTYFDAKRPDTNVNEYESSLGESVDVTGYLWMIGYNPRLGTDEVHLGGQGPLFKLFDAKAFGLAGGSARKYGYLCMI